MDRYIHQKKIKRLEKGINVVRKIYIFDIRFSTCEKREKSYWSYPSNKPFLFDENTSLFAKSFTKQKALTKKIRCKCLVISVTPTGFKPITF
jgi:hypothetical protein